MLVLGSSTSTTGVNSALTKKLLGDGLQVLERIYVLLDPDVAGRQARQQLELMFPKSLWHAFIPAPLAMSSSPSRCDLHYFTATGTVICLRSLLAYRLEQYDFMICQAVTFSHECTYSLYTIEVFHPGGMMLETPAWSMQT